MIKKLNIDTEAPSHHPLILLPTVCSFHSSIDDFDLLVCGVFAVSLQENVDMLVCVCECVCVREREK